MIRMWPLAVLFYVGLLVMRIAGYQTAAWYYASRSLLCGAVIVCATILYQLIQGYLTRRLGPLVDSDDENELIEDADLGTLRRGFFLRTLASITFAAVAVFGILAAGAVLGLSGSDWNDLLGTTIWARTTRPSLTLGDLGASVAVFVFTLFLARLVRDGFQVMLRDRMQRGPRFAVRTMFFYLIAGIGTILALSALGLDLDQLGWFLTAAGVGIGFGLQEIISNFISGLILFFERPVQVGDVVSIGTVQGDVTRINIRSTVVRTRDGISIIIPNKKLITDDVINLSHGDPKTRLRLSISVSYGSDLSLVKKVLLDVAEREGRALTKPRAEVNFKEFGDSSLNFELLIWLPRPDITLRRRVTSDLNSAIDAAFRRVGITIPFPQRDLHLRTWDKEALEEPEEPTLKKDGASPAPPPSGTVAP
jgi:small-conductance mechanosensitive channel